MDNKTNSSRIIDAHIHLGQPYYDLQKIKDVFSDIFSYMSESNVEKCILMSNTSGKKVFGNNEMVYALSEACSECFAWMCNIREESSTNDIFQELVDCKMRGACGIGELMIHKRFDSFFYEQLFEVAQILELPVLFHISPCEGFSYGIIDNPGLPLLERALSIYKNLNFIGHSQPFWQEISGDAMSSPEARNSWGRGRVHPGGRLLYLLDNYNNLYCDLSANSGGQAIMRDESFGLWFLERYSKRLIFGSDVIGDNNRYPLLRWMKNMVVERKISEETFSKICYENACEIYFNRKM